MADSDYDFEDEVSDDDYIGDKGSASNTRAQSTAATKRRKVEVPVKEAPQRKAWETEYSRTVEKTIQPADDGSLGQSVQEREEERKRKRLRKDTKPFQRGIIRHVVLVLDLSEAMLEKDMRPNRFITMINFTQDYIREFFEQNPISQMSVLGMHDECSRVGESNTLPYAQSWHTRGYRRFWQLAESGPWRHSPVCQGVCEGSDTRDESEYTIATDQEMLRELLLATTTPPVIRQPLITDEVAPATTTQSSESAAALMMMGFPSRVVEDQLTMCACHGNLTMGGYTCSRCSAKVCSLPITCPSCQLTLLLSTHLARSYHHLFPLRNWATVSWSRAREMGSKQCVGCLAAFSNPPSNAKENGEAKRDSESKVTKKDDDDSEEQKASESGRYECRACESHFCIDCDMFAHMVLHNCPGCLGRLDPNAAATSNGDVEMSAGRTMAAFERLIRFEDAEGKTVYGNLEKEVPTREIQGSTVEVLEGDVKSGFKKTGSKATVSKLLSPLPTTNIILCVGLNYRKHAQECNLQIPENPAIFMKPSDALAGPLDDVPIHPTCQSQLDYEGELGIIIGRDCKNVAAADYASYVLGYTVGNDVSARNYQLPASVSGGQFGYAKSFDKFAPIGPCIASPAVIPDPHALTYWTKVNGEKRQETGTDDMIYTVGQIIEHLSRGTTLRAGTVILTGTPSGVGFFMEPKGFLKDGDVVEIYVQGIGSLVNTMRFE
ncbi:hypothetical protein COCVIDRAFT_42161 [Bipolaris victoriae FI3]|uniref:C2H2-type domain-containing protein n=2 Tax=Bipolaris TaxID=33194 RepID=W6Y4P0_COCC2|nr:uncharacterized protein COCCADRAFT_37452 [Bipolaris zeicola 26-R-13]XP_014551567.1 hypothetical protein COCVIDRAFT_42161 [Bipolaris victoriae FI3]EUC32630.1 hypothetical protein COCCADRAFT_37452 [Bipolaris zeicola 26-R-13]